MQEVLNTLERHTVCTGTQCFESEEDAFGITTTPNGSPSNSTNFFMFMMCAAPSPPSPQTRPCEGGHCRALQATTRSPRRLSIPKGARGARSLLLRPAPPSRTSTARHYIAPRTPVSPIGQHAG